MHRWVGGLFFSSKGLVQGPKLVGGQCGSSYPVKLLTPFNLPPNPSMHSLLPFVLLQRPKEYGNLLCISIQVIHFFGAGVKARLGGKAVLARLNFSMKAWGSRGFSSRAPPPPARACWLPSPLPGWFAPSQRPPSLTISKREWTSLSAASWRPAWKG